MLGFVVGLGVVPVELPVEAGGIVPGLLPVLLVGGGVVPGVVPFGDVLLGLVVLGVPD